MKTYKSKEAWLVYKPNASIINGQLLFKDGKPFKIITEDDSIFSIDENHDIYFNKSEAYEAVENYKKEIKKLCRETKNNIEKLDLLYGLAKRTDFIPDDILNINSCYTEYYDICDMLTSYIHGGMININAVSFTKESVSHVNWGEGAAEIVLKCGQKIRTYNHAELELVSRVFGGYNGERYFTDIKPEEEEENND